MAFPTSCIFSILLLTSIALISVASSSSSDHKVTKSDIDHMCSLIHDRDRCHKLLTSEFHAVGKSPTELAQAAVNFASKRAYEFKALVHNIASSTRDRRTKEIFTSCIKNYENAVRDIDSVDKELYSGHARSVTDGKLMEAYDEIKSCQKQFHESVHNDRAHMKNHNHDVEFALSVAKRTVDHLKK